MIRSGPGTAGTTRELLHDFATARAEERAARAEERAEAQFSMAKDAHHKTMEGKAEGKIKKEMAEGEAPGVEKEVGANLEKRERREAERAAAMREDANRPTTYTQVEGMLLPNPPYTQRMPRQRDEEGRVTDEDLKKKLDIITADRLADRISQIPKKLREEAVEKKELDKRLLHTIANYMYPQPQTPGPTRQYSSDTSKAVGKMGKGLQESPPDFAELPIRPPDHVILDQLEGYTKRQEAAQEKLQTRIEGHTLKNILIKDETKKRREHLGKNLLGVLNLLTSKMKSQDEKREAGEKLWTLINTWGGVPLSWPKANLGSTVLPWKPNVKFQQIASELTTIINNPKFSFNKKLTDIKNKIIEIITATDLSVPEKNENISIIFSNIKSLIEKNPELASKNLGIPLANLSANMREKIVAEDYASRRQGRKTRKRQLTDQVLARIDEENLIEESERVAQDSALDNPDGRDGRGVAMAAAEAMAQRRARLVASELGPWVAPPIRQASNDSLGGSRNRKTRSRNRKTRSRNRKPRCRNIKTRFRKRKTRCRKRKTRCRNR